MGYNKINYNNNFIKEKYDRINFTMPKGSKQMLEAKAKEKGFNSVGEYLKDLIARDMAGGAHKDTIE